MTNKIVKCIVLSMMVTKSTPEPLAVLDDVRRLGAVLPPLRRRLLECLEEADSATGLARKLGLARQKVNYHLRALEDAGLVECVEELRKRGCTERLVRLTARAFVVSPGFLGSLGADPDQLRDRFSSGYLMAVASRTLRDVAVLRERADTVKKKLVTCSMQTEVSFASPADMAAFTDELTESLAALVSKYHRPGMKKSRPYRFTVGGHPVITKTEAEAAAEQAERGRAARKEKQS